MGTPAVGVPQLSDSQATKILTSKALTMTQNIYSATVFPPSNPIISNLIPRNVGVVKRFVVEVLATLTNTDGAATATLTDTGLANLISNVTFYDLQNNLRINTTGLHLNCLSTAKRRRPFAATANWNTADGNNVSQMMNVPPALWPVFQAPATIAHGASATVRAVFEIPLAYSDDDLRGAIFANVINTTMNLQITLNTNAFTAAGDTTYAVYSGAPGTFTSAVVNVYQVYLDQLPVNPQTGKYILPQTSLSTVYELKNTNLQAITANQDFPIPFANFRSFLSAFIVYNNNGAANGRVLGTDIAYWSLSTANFTNIFKYDPLFNIMLSREIVMADFPAGFYYFSFRKQPIWTTQYGNQQINLNASNVNAGAYAQVMWEDMALQNTLSGGASLPA
jgi:P3 major capsid protein